MIIDKHNSNHKKVFLQCSQLTKNTFENKHHSTESLSANSINLIKYSTAHTLYSTQMS